MPLVLFSKVVGTDAVFDLKAIRKIIIMVLKSVSASKDVIGNNKITLGVAIGVAIGVDLALVVGTHLAIRYDFLIAFIQRVTSSKVIVNHMIF